VPRWLGDVLRAIHGHARSSSVRLTYKALVEMAGLDPAVSPEEALELLAGLTRSRFRYRVRSARTGEWLYVFRAAWCGERIYLKLLLRADCTIVSFHPEDSDHEHEEGEDSPG
jgi:hypothetical protein